MNLFESSKHQVKAKMCLPLFITIIIYICERIIHNDMWLFKIIIICNWIEWIGCVCQWIDLIEKMFTVQLNVNANVNVNVLVGLLTTIITSVYVCSMQSNPIYMMIIHIKILLKLNMNFSVCDLIRQNVWIYYYKY